MGFWSLFPVACMPILQLLLVGLLGALLATEYIKLLPCDARRYINKLVYVIFAPALVFASLAKTVTLQDIISWWFMPVNIAMTFLIGGVLGWIAVKILRPDRHLEGLVISSCSAGNLGNLLLILVPAICQQDGNPFGDSNSCHASGLSYVSFSMALGGVFIWTIAYSLMKKSAAIYGKILHQNGSGISADACHEVNIVSAQNGEPKNSTESAGAGEDQRKQPLLPSKNIQGMKQNLWEKVKEILHQIAEELLTPPTIAAALGLIVGAFPWLKSLVAEESAPLRVIQDSMLLLGAGTIPCITLILGGNLLLGLRKSAVKPSVVAAIICVRYVILPLSGIAVVKGAGEVGFLPQSPLYRFVLLIQFTLPPAMSIGTMAQLFDVGQEECSVIFMWTYLVAAFALTFWSVVFMWILS
ncbi:protein PIN-LIKES 7-like [Canna indica]|uniref:Protein PIN-LIKES 7-like n=1 Tax=Canna indica TaxID=4628 RepID=A0AAQ3KXB9_9LILI|nr:protein PIN-LIKES 7-like [Canna indica]